MRATNENSLIDTRETVLGFTGLCHGCLVHFVTRELKGDVT